MKCRRSAQQKHKFNLRNCNLSSHFACIRGEQLFPAMSGNIISAWIVNMVINLSEICLCVLKTTENENLGAHCLTSTTIQIRWKFRLPPPQFWHSDRYKIVHMTQHLFWQNPAATRQPPSVTILLSQVSCYIWVNTNADLLYFFTRALYMSVWTKFYLLSDIHFWHLKRLWWIGLHRHRHRRVYLISKRTCSPISHK